MAKVESKSIKLTQRRSWQPGSEVRLTSERLQYLSPPPAECAATVASWFADPEVGRFLAAPPTTEKKAEAAIAGANNRTSFFFGVFTKEPQKLIGYTQVQVIYGNRWARTTSVIGDKACWGGGYAVEARTAILDFLFRSYGINKVSSYVYARNIPAIFNNRALGYSCEGVLRQHERDPEGGFRDVMCFGILRSEWLARRASQPRAEA